MSYTIKDNKVIPDPPGQYEYGERYVACDKCGIKRPAGELEPFETRSLIEDSDKDYMVFCKDKEWCSRISGHA